MKSSIALLSSSFLLLGLSSCLPGPEASTAAGTTLQKRAPPTTYFLSDCSVFENGSKNSEVDFYKPGNAPSTTGADRGPDGRCDPPPQSGQGLAWEGATHSCDVGAGQGVANVFIDAGANQQPEQTQVGTLLASGRTYACKVDNQRVIYTDKTNGKVSRICRAMYYCQ